MSATKEIYLAANGQLQMEVAFADFLFLWYLRINQALLAKPVEQLINDNTLVALALLIAESQPAQKELMTRLIEHFVLLKADN